MTRILTIPAAALFVTLAACAFEPPTTKPQTHVQAANAFTTMCAGSRLARWKVRADAAGPACNVLVVDASVILEDTMIEAMHYGAGPYTVYGGGIEKFARERRFRGVVYRDVTRRLWTYGTVSEDEAEKLQPCR